MRGQKEKEAGVVLPPAPCFDILSLVVALTHHDGSSLLYGSSCHLCAVTPLALGMACCPLWQVSGFPSVSCVVPQPCPHQSLSTWTVFPARSLMDTPGVLDPHPGFSYFPMLTCVGISAINPYHSAWHTKVSKHLWDGWTNASTHSNQCLRKN